MSQKISDQKVPLLFSLLQRRFLLAFPHLFDFGLLLTHVTTCEDFGVVAYVRGGEGLSLNIGYPIAELILKRRDETSIFVVQGVADIEGRPTAVAMGLQVRLINSVAQEELVPPFLIP